MEPYLEELVWVRTFESSRFSSSMTISIPKLNDQLLRDGLKHPSRLRTYSEKGMVLKL